MHSYPELIFMWL